MSFRERTNYLPKCDYPGCAMFYEFWSPTRETAIEDVIYDEEWLCLFTGDNEPRFFCPLHLRHRPDSSPDDSPTVLFDSDSPTTQPALHALNKYYEDMSTPQPLPKLECEYTILAVLTSEDSK